MSWWEWKGNAVSVVVREGVGGLEDKTSLGTVVKVQANGDTALLLKSFVTFPFEFYLMISIFLV